MIIAPDLDIPAKGGLSIDWRGIEKIQSDGAVERHYVGGRLHHYELTSKLMS
ncbi:putative protein OS=Tsukamurella paurometabola (strain ATCC 8368 / DSM / CCUG 35730 /CIP 100753 / JCM 10117 / KCTC 9821 / NBRC 16120 / NCIMB 702349/ NCTC 13040) OX=521096 GN=Tpau_3902 PE=4 SV=1 [Tsukamurella paurometabola]|uniref:Uncharacterized protein n=1 Tax=Tsukamurella paurometabola (strain ATCC 8368 / DSM 20162 / CCUG 35730 / CIP 100753 / JCM 10117 / KCTC 9821 / NBRC 16120 / NCIMB 702349 / NCTC 13040) TaxID=521096 RepID=D5UMK0_TSUPD|nr:hypothetical protein [Tsukamurella paurometabola]ADG80474.1 hypothetical protein Tpau_3902 [Tsukamurella paurometabola DSM 20162]SUP39780.1 Uncharacterised protein [Tsukamurella paurometabola]